MSGRLLSAVLKGRNVALHISSLGRAREAAEIICNFIDAAPVIEPRIQEVSIGSWDGLTHVDRDAGWPGRLNGCNAGFFAHQTENRTKKPWCVSARG
jgi:broad specificity phosphatase PhoE